MANQILGSGPGLQVEYSGQQTWAGGTSRTVKVTFGAKVHYKSSSSRFGYRTDYRIVVNGTAGSWRQMKGNEMWYGSNDYRWFSDSVTTNVGTTSSTSVSCRVEFHSYDTSTWRLQTSNISVPVSSTNTKPVMEGSVSVSPGGTLSEKHSSVRVTAPTGRDSENNIAGYRIQASVNGGDYYTIYSGSGREYNHDISSYGEGTSIRYRADCWDTGSLWSEAWAYSDTIYKNIFTVATLASSSSVSYSGSPLTFTYSGERNTQSGIGASTYRLKCDELTIHNIGTVGSTIKVGFNWGQNGGTDGPYINWSDVVSKFGNGSSKGKGTLNFTLTGTNANGTTKTSKKTISVNIQTPPNPATDLVMSTSPSESTAYRKHVGTGNWYYVPDGSKVIRAKWNNGSGKINDGVIFKVYYSLDSGSWVYLGETSSRYYDCVIPKQTSAMTLRIHVKTVSLYNSDMAVDTTSSPTTIHYYNSPTFTRGTVSRSASGAEVTFTVKTITSLPRVETSGRWECSNGTSNSLSTSQSQQLARVSGLSEDSGYKFTVRYSDTTGFTETKEGYMDIPANQSIFFVNKYGVGVGGAKADSTVALNVKGTVNIDGQFASQIKKSATSVSWLSGARGQGSIINMPNKNGYNPIVRQKTTNGAWTIGTYNEEALLFSYMSDRTITADSNTLDGQVKIPYNVFGTVYTTGNKPSPEDIGAARADHTHPGLGNTLANGGTINGILKVNDTIQAYAYGKSNNKAAITIDKPGSGCFGIGANGNAMQIQYGQVNDLNGGWSGSQGLTHIFKGHLESSGGNVVARGGYLYTDTGTLWMGNDDKIWYNDSSNYFNFYADDSLWSSGIDVGNVMFKTLRNKGSNMDVDLSNGVSMWFNTGSSTNSHWFINRAFSGSSGTECSFYPSRGGGFGWVGSSGYPVFKVYSYNFLTASKRSNKYDITKASSEDFYSYVKDLDVYTYRHDSSSEDPDSKEYTITKRQDLQIGCMVDELPTEVIDYDVEGGEGKAVDLYAYSSMILGATKELIKKVEILERENIKLTERVEMLEQEKVKEM